MGETWELMKSIKDSVRKSINESWFGRSIDWLGRNFGAFMRQGSKEIAQVIPAFPDSIRPVEELGTLGNPTQLQVNRELGEPLYGYSGYQDWLEGRAKEVQVRERQPPEMGMERE